VKILLFRIGMFLVFRHKPQVISWTNLDHSNSELFFFFQHNMENLLFMITDKMRSTGGYINKVVGVVRDKKLKLEDLI
jgi:hypothetical protein